MRRPSPKITAAALRLQSAKRPIMSLPVKRLDRNWIRLRNWGLRFLMRNNFLNLLMDKVDSRFYLSEIEQRFDVSRPVPYTPNLDAIVGYLIKDYIPSHHNTSRV